MWRWPPDSPLHDKVEQSPLILKLLPQAYTPHQAPPPTGHHMVILIEAGIFVLGLGQEDSVEQLYRVRRYMVRKSQGKSQMNHNSKGGRQSYGARLRHRESRDFIKKIVGALNEATQSIGPCQHTWWHCSPQIKGFLRKESPKLLSVLEEKSSKLPGPIEIQSETALKSTWHRITYGRFLSN